MLKIKNKFLLFFLIFIIYITHNWINFFYNSTNNVDFSKYYDFVNYFLGLDVILDYGQGSLYYYLLSLFLRRHLDLIDLENIDILITASIHELNLLFFLIGLWGLYKLLETNGYDKKIILLCLILLNFFPQSLYMRAVMKPEILAFAFFPWCLFFIELFLKSKNLKFIYFSFPALIIILNSKASLAAMAALYLLIFYSKILRLINIKQICLLVVTFLFLVFLVQIENYRITQLLPFERVYEEEYDFKAEPSILFRTDLVEVFKNPFFKYDYQDNFYSIHAKSVINLTILDTFGDHFNQLFDSSINYFSKNRKDIFTNESNSFINTDRQIKYNGPFSYFLVNNLDHLRKIISSLIGIVFYILIIYFSIINRKKSKYLLAPFVGIFVLYLNSLGIPSNNFNPFKGDTFKSFYYSFFLMIALSILVCEVFKKNKYIVSVLITLFFCISIIFISGHPKANNQLTSERIIVTNEYSIFCSVNNLLFLENNLLQKIHPSGNIENYKSDCENQSISKSLYKINFQDFKNSRSEICFNDEGNLIKSTSNSKECRIFWIKKAQNLDTNDNQTPLFAMLYFMSMISILFLNIEIVKNYLINRKAESNVNKNKF